MGKRDVQRRIDLRPAARSGIVNASGGLIQGVGQFQEAFIGAWHIAAYTLTDRAKTMGFSTVITEEDDVRLWINGAVPTEGQFRVTESGVVTASAGHFGYGQSLAAIGDLAGLYGYPDDAGPIYGNAVGAYEPGATWIGTDVDNGLRIMNYQTRTFQVAPSGVAAFGRADQNEIIIDPLNAELRFSYAGVTQMALDAQNGTLYGIWRLGRPLGPCLELSTIPDISGDERLERFGLWLRNLGGDRFFSVLSGTEAAPETASFRVGTQGSDHYLEYIDGVLNIAGNITILNPEGSTAVAWDDVTGKPATLGTPGAAGLYLGATQMGYYTGAAWTTYIDSSGNFYLGGAGGPLIWSAGTSTLLLGGWSMTSAAIFTGTEDHSGYTANAGDITLYSDGTNASIHAKNFYIDASGNLTATSATLTGAVTADTGYIGGTGGWTIVAGKLYGGSGSAFSGMIQGTGTTKAFFAGATDNAGTGATFYVTAAGAVTATVVTVTGTVNATGGYVGSAATALVVEAGGFNVGTTGAVRGGKANYADATAGFFLGYDAAAYKFIIGGTDYLRWTGSALQAQFGGAGAVTLDANGLSLGISSTVGGDVKHAVTFKDANTNRQTKLTVYDTATATVAYLYNSSLTLEPSIAISAVGPAAQITISANGTASKVNFLTDTINFYNENGDPGAVVNVDGTIYSDSLVVNPDGGNFDTNILTDAGYSALFVDASADSVEIMHDPRGKVAFFAASPVVQQEHIANPSGGATTDAEARTAINSILTALETYGLLKAS